MAVFAFDDFIDGLMRSLIKAKNVAEEQFLNLLPRENSETIYFEREEDTGQLNPKMIEVALSPLAATGKSHTIQVPMISLVPFKSLQMSKLTIEF